MNSIARRRKEKVAKILVPLARASTVAQTESPATQMALIERFAAANGYTLVSDLPTTIAFESGAYTDRDQVLAALDLIRRGCAGGIIVTRLDRLARNLMELLKITQVLDKYGASLICTEQKIDTGSIEGRLFCHMLGALAEFERELIGKRITEGKHKAKANGRFGGGGVPYGYKVIRKADEPKAKYLELDLAKQKNIDTIMEMRAQGRSMQSIADVLTARTRRQWHRTQVIRIYDREMAKGHSGVAQ